MIGVVEQGLDQQTLRVHDREQGLAAGHDLARRGVAQGQHAADCGGQRHPRAEAVGDGPATGGQARVLGLGLLELLTRGVVAELAQADQVAGEVLDAPVQLRDLGLQVGAVDRVQDRHQIGQDLTLADRGSEQRQTIRRQLDAAPQRGLHQRTGVRVRDHVAGQGEGVRPLAGLRAGGADAEQALGRFRYEQGSVREARGGLAGGGCRRSCRITGRVRGPVVVSLVGADGSGGVQRQRRRREEGQRHHRGLGRGG